MGILLIEDDERITEFVQRGLRAEGYSVDVARDGEAAWEMARGAKYQLIILDLLLPGIDGREICRRLRNAKVSSAILMLTALDTLEDKVEGLRIGADDYLTKPFAFAELLARIEALLRRPKSYEAEEPRLAVGDLELDRDNREVRRAGRAIKLTPKEFSLLECLMRSPGKVLSKTKILENAWGYSSDPLTNVVEVYIRHLRRKIDEGFDQALIKTVRGFGYKIDAESAE